VTFRDAILTVLKAKSPQSMADVYAKVEKLLKLTDVQKAVTLASGEATCMRHCRFADRQLRQAGLIVTNDDRTRSAVK